MWFLTWPCYLPVVQKVACFSKRSELKDRVRNFLDAGRQVQLTLKVRRLNRRGTADVGAAVRERRGGCWMPGSTSITQSQTVQARSYVMLFRKPNLLQNVDICIPEV